MTNKLTCEQLWQMLPQKITRLETYPTYGGEETQEKVTYYLTLKKNILRYEGLQESPRIKVGNLRKALLEMVTWYEVFSVDMAYIYVNET